MPDFLRRFVKVISKRWLFSTMGGAIAMVLSFGLALVRGITRELVPSWQNIAADIMAEAVTYGYVLLSTLLVSMTLGWLVGDRAIRLERMGHTDPLTHLPNRRGFLKALQDELRRAARYHTSLTVLLLDLDYLKQINDTHGHKVGDQALRAVAQSLGSSCRSTDYPARYGGDEFAIIAPSTSAHEARELASRIRQKLALLSQEQSLQAQSWTVSIGIADLTATHTYHAEELLLAADEVLYEAKSRGRDQAVVADPVMEPDKKCSAVA